VRTSDFTPGLPIEPLALSARDVPHVTIETNRTCNMRCRLCYNLDREHVKSVDDVKMDLETALSLRRLAAVTLLGGEPTLYPGLPEVIGYVKSRGLFCALLTNGLRFLDGDGPELLDRIKQAGVDRVYIHVDSGQAHVHADIEAARERMSRLLEAARVPFALSVTLYGGDDDELAAVIRRYSRFSYFEGVLTTLPHDPSGRTAPHSDLREVYEGLKAGLGLEPISFIPADADDGDVRWLIYFYIMNARTGEAFPVSAKVQRLAQKIFRWAPGTQFFAQTLGPAYLRASLVPIVLAELLFSPRRTAALYRLVRGKDAGDAGPRPNGGGFAGLGHLRAQFITIQAPPKIDFASGRASICRHCPDATVRNGKLVPVCIADLVSPLNPLIQPKLACPEM
jgi:pyruvate-formate lyase-activating enzyme